MDLKDNLLMEEIDESGLWPESCWLQWKQTAMQLLSHRSWEQTALMTLSSGAQLSHCAKGMEHSYMIWGAGCCWVVQVIDTASEHNCSCRASTKRLKMQSCFPSLHLPTGTQVLTTHTVNTGPWTWTLCLRLQLCEPLDSPTAAASAHTVTALSWEVAGTKLALALWLLLCKVKQVSILCWWPKCFRLP